MKKQLILFFLFSIANNITFAQTRAEQRLKEEENSATIKLFDEFDKDNDLYNFVIPDSFKTAPAIILYNQTTYSYTNTSLKGNKKIHKKVLIQDKTAVDDFSTFYIDTKENDKLAIRLLKKNGTVITFSGARNFIKVDKGYIPRIYYSDYSRAQTYYKFAIPDIEQGDTLEYIINETIYGASFGEMGSAYQPVDYFFNSIYPILKSKIKIKMSEKNRLSALSLNGAPSFVKQNICNRNEVEYLIDYRNINALNDVRWVFPLREYPLVKFQVFYTSKIVKEEKRGFFMSYDSDSIKSSVNKDDVMKKSRSVAHGNWNDKSIYMDGLGFESDFHSQLKTKNNLSEDEKVEFLYDYLRKAQINESRKMNDENFAQLFLYMMRKINIVGDLVIVPIRLSGNLNSLLFSHELYFAVKYKDKFIFPAHRNSCVFDKDDFYTGQTGYIANIDPESKKGKVLEVSPIQIPNSTYEENKITTKVIVDILDDEFAKIKVIDTNYYTGLEKRNYRLHQNKLMELASRYDNEFIKVKPNYNIRIIDKDGNILRAKDSYYIYSYNYNDLSKNKNYETDVRNAAYKSLLDDIDESLTNTFSAEIIVDSFDVIDLGRSNKNKELIDTKIYQIENYIKKAGQNYLFEIGKFIGKQPEISQIELKRKENVWLDFPSEYNTEVIFNIPNGYKVEGLSNFKSDFSNEYGSFSSVAIEENGKIILKTKKIYKTNFVPNSNWINLIEVLNSSYNLTQKQLILKKI